MISNFELLFRKCISDGNRAENEDGQSKRERAITLSIFHVLLKQPPDNGGIGGEKKTLSPNLHY